MKIETRYRRIVSEIPHPRSRPILDELRRIEPRSMSGMPPVVWHKAAGYQVWDAYGNRWIDFTSAVILANAGHANPIIAAGIRRQLDRKLWHSYCNPSQIRLDVLKALGGILPRYLDKIFLLTTGSEAVECAIKLIRLHGRRTSPEKYHILSFAGSFHGRTMGSQTAGGFSDQHRWMGRKPAGFHHIPFPECDRCPWGRRNCQARCGEECFHRGLGELSKRVDPRQIAGVLTETFQGPTVAFMPTRYVRALRKWADENGSLLAFDEIQAGFGRTGRWFGFEHYGVRPDLIALGKGMTSCLPMSAVAGRGELLDLAGPGEMSSTHTGNPLCAAATIANIKAIRRGNLIRHARQMEPTARRALLGLRQRFPRQVGAIHGRGLVWSVYLLNPKTGRLDPPLASRVTSLCMERGLLMMQTGRGTLKIAPPLSIPRAAFLEGAGVIADALEECL